MRPVERELVAAPEPELEVLSRLARQTLGGEAPRREATSFIRIGEKVAARRRRAHVVARAAALGASLLVVLAGLALFRHASALTFRVVNGAVVDGTRIVGGAGTEVRFSDGSKLELAPGAETHVAALDAHGARVRLDDGSARVSITKRPGAAWTLGAGPYAVRVTGTAFSLRWSRRAQAFEIAMRAGSVIVTGPLVRDGIALHAGQRCSIAGGRLLVEEGARELASIAAAAPPARAAVTPSAPADATGATPVAPAPPAPSSSDASRSTPAGVAPGGTPPSAPLALGWHEKAEQGAFAEVLAAAEQRGLDATLASAPLDDLAALADSARYARRTDVARRALLAERSRFPKSNAAREAAFFLGRLAETDGASALDWYDRYLVESPAGPYASQALGRKMMLVYRQHGGAAARAIAAEYLARFPNGPYAATAAKLGAE